MTVTRLIVCSLAVVAGSIVTFAVPIAANEDQCKAYYCSASDTDCVQQSARCGLCAPDMTCRSVY